MSDIFQLNLDFPSLEAGCSTKLWLRCHSPRCHPAENCIRWYLVWQIW